MNKYSYAMFSSYMFPALLFFYIPWFALLFISNSRNEIGEFVISAVMFSIFLFGSGAVLAPFLGPRISKNKFLSFLMAILCQSLATLGFIASLKPSGSATFLDACKFLFPYFFVYGILPSLLGGLLFLCACQKIQKI